MGNYVNNHLIRDEQVMYETDYHWIIFISIKAVLTLFIKPMIERWTSEFAITNKRVIIKTGLVSRKTIEMNLLKIESVNVDQSILGRILGFGDITIIGTGGTKETFHKIKKPITFRKKFQELSLWNQDYFRNFAHSFHGILAGFMIHHYFPLQPILTQQLAK